MIKVRLIPLLLGLAMLCLPVYSLADSCSIACPTSGSIFCTITAAPGNTANCWVEPGNGSIVCCEFNQFGTPVRDIHRTCPPPPNPCEFRQSGEVKTSQQVQTPCY